MAKVKIIHTQSEEILFECDLVEVDKAYKMFSEFEEMGLDIKLIVPSTPETLIDQLSVSDEDKAIYKKSLAEEIESHEDDSCCYKPAGFETKKLQ